MSRQRWQRTRAEHLAAVDELERQEQLMRESIRKQCERAREKEQAGQDTAWCDGYIVALEGAVLMIETARTICVDLAGPEPGPGAAAAPAPRQPPADLPEHAEPAPWWALLKSTPGLIGTTLSLARQHQSLDKSAALLWIESGLTAADSVSRVQLLDELLEHHGYVRASQPRWVPADHATHQWAVLCDVTRPALLEGGS